MTGADRARFIGTIRRVGEHGPDPEIHMERLRSADGTEQITFRGGATRPVRLPVEIRLGTDLAELGSVAVVLPCPGLRAAVHGSGLRWSGPGVHAVVSATPGPVDVLASAGLLRWELALPPVPAAPSNCLPGWNTTRADRAVLRGATGAPVSPTSRPAHRAGGLRTRGDWPPRPCTAARLECDDHRADALMPAVSTISTAW
ncbi:glycogen debranching N-terminal domain-containing protein [Streptomyces sp. NPDC048637]|uniref:glycogen debranching N-terminal domain-containing protein n=1 Tax=Streptomyces sp. NPDC048637 TaxID=3155636 RepID=UPI0034386E0A